MIPQVCAVVGGLDVGRGHKGLGGQGAAANDIVPQLPKHCAQRHFHPNDRRSDAQRLQYGNMVECMHVLEPKREM